MNRPDELEDIYVPAGFKRLKYQEEAVLSAKKVLEEYGGLFLSDVVGLGKTYMAALLAQQLDGRSLVIAPPHLLDKHNPGSWPNVFGDFRVPHTDFESSGKLEDLLQRDVSKYANVFIDESRRLRTETNQTYEMLAQICRGKRIILVSATPMNNTPGDILSQVKLFQNGKNSTIPIADSRMRHRPATGYRRRCGAGAAEQSGCRSLMLILSKSFTCGHINNDVASPWTSA